MGEPMAIALWTVGALVGGVLLAFLLSWAGKRSKTKMPRINGSTK